MTSVPQTILWLDDERDPRLPRWQTHLPDEAADVVWVQTFEQFVTHIETNGLPAAVCFDHDLGQPQSGLDAAKWLTQYCLKHGRSLP
ncbi:MAG: hypothetical protein NXI04_13710 [Planctomycetaceae bacterium]|nr:hypothetical protein [Planctomycetaceae bacterium]